MLEICVTVLLIAWLLGLLSSYTLGGAIHVCLVLALIFLAIRIARRRPPPQGGSPDALSRGRPDVHAR
jgi:hypothetical protein